VARTFILPTELLLEREHSLPILLHADHRPAVLFRLVINRRVYAQQVYGIPAEQVVGTAGGIKYGYGKDGKPFLTKEPKLILNDNNAGKPEAIHLMIGRRPFAAFGNSTHEVLPAAGHGGRYVLTIDEPRGRRCLV
jgi:hypothetical protein